MLRFNLKKLTTNLKCLEYQKVATAHRYHRKHALQLLWLGSLLLKNNLKMHKKKC